MKWFRLIVAVYGTLTSIGFTWWVSGGIRRSEEVGFLWPYLILVGFVVLMFAYLVTSHGRRNNENRS